jgi:CheY-like chemotaxis protein
MDNEKHERLVILLVEDHAIFARSVKTALNKHKVIFARSVEEAIEHYKQEIPDIVLLDINLPDGTGYDALKEIREFDPESFVVMLTGSSQKEDVVKSKELNCSGYILKPPTNEKLEKYIDEYYKYRTYLNTQLIHQANQQSHVRILKSEMEKDITGTQDNNDPKDKKPTSIVPPKNGRLQVLLCDHEGSNQTAAITTELALLDADITTVCSGENALDALGKHFFHITIIDYNLNDMDGFHLASRIRQNNRVCGSYNYIIGLGYFSKNETDQWKSVGMDEFFTKPLPSKQLYRFILANISDILKNDSLAPHNAQNT